MITTYMLIQLLVIIVVLGIVTYLVENYVPMTPIFRILFRCVLALGVCIWLLRLAGLL